MSMTPKTRYYLDEAIAALPERTSLFFVSQGEGLTDEQVGFFLARDLEKLDESFEEWESNQVFYSCKALLNEALGFDADAVAAVSYDPDAWLEFREACEERNESSYLDDLLRQSYRKMVKYNLDFDVDPAWTMSEDEADECLREIAAAAGIDYDANASALKALMGNATYGGSLHVLHYTELIDLQGAVKVTFTDPVLLIHDRLNGSGDMEQVTGTVVVEIGDETMRHDAGRMSWSDHIAAISYSSCDTPASFEKAQVKA